MWEVLGLIPSTIFTLTPQKQNNNTGENKDVIFFL